ncbi:dTMP kinase [Propionibacterium freudenreichii]|uniref:dTMP kinase n=1 Tax=Propionibacterium freudenreichii TaxID=1744 RepID=UPI0024343888|nr:dTMP kinase [Propionibacterium freudenreichii]MDK9302774.1 dTMP kinase [Propionibacterium freudenreichii]MDK9341006.1 dTMP kinase [Propionibacterium freudenreichii]MDK9649650.1 dTMP kinase [Propionibacterium freudenreichii]WFF32625.1 dTMP kinase [Propionibacterium freudenreichii]
MSTRRYPGWFVVFEGGDGVGKSTQVELLADALADAGVSHLVTREPGGTPLGDNIRELLLDPASGDVAPRAEALLYAADKAQHLHEVVVPALAAGKVVVCDRYLDSMLAYQGAGRVLELREVADIADWATRGLRPDLTVLLDLDPDEAVGVKEHKDRLEQAGVEFHRRVRQGFLDLANADPERYLVLPGRQGREWAAGRVRERLRGLGVQLIG